MMDPHDIKEEKMEGKRRNCKVCFHAYTGTDRRPRCIPCGHTICSKCVFDKLQENLLVCPFCRQEHKAKSPQDFPVNYEVEGFLFDSPSNEPVSLEPHNLTNTYSVSISKKLKSMRTELSKGMEDIGIKSQDLKSQLNEYQLLMNEWREKHQRVVEDFSLTIQEHEDMIKYIEKEYESVLQAVMEEEEEKKRMNKTKERLYAASTGIEIIPALDEADHCYDALENWIQAAQQNFPDVNLITKSMAKLEMAETALVTLKTKRESEVAISPDTKEGAWSKIVVQNPVLAPLHSTACSDFPPVSVASGSVPSVHEKIGMALQKAALHRQNVESRKVTQRTEIQTEGDGSELQSGAKDAHVQTDSLLTVRSLSHMFAVQEDEKDMHYAKITLQDNQLYLHVLTDQAPPVDAFILQHRDVRSLINPWNRKAFLVFGTNQTTLGSVVISLSRDTKRSTNFAALCMGVKGPSYLDTSIYDISDKENAGELVMCGDYEYNNGKGGKAVVPGAGKKWGGEVKPKVAGSVCGLFTVTGDSGAAKFGIVTREDSSWNIPAVFGKVESGLHVLIDAVSRYPNISDVKIVDCGIVLSI